MKINKLYRVKKILGIAIIIIIGWVLYENLGVKYLSKIKDEKFNDYYSLNSNKVESENYKIRKLDIKMYEIESIQYDSITTNYIVASKTTQARSLWKINKYGVLIDSIVGEGGRGKKILVIPNSLGMVFKNHHYTDWAISGDKANKKYQLLIDYDNLSKKDFSDYLAKASLIFFKKNEFYTKDTIENKMFSEYKKVGQCFVFINNKWNVIQSEKLFKDLEFVYNRTSKIGYYKINGKLFYDIKKQFRCTKHHLKDIVVKSDKYTIPRRIDSVGKPIVELQHFTKKSRSRKRWVGLGIDRSQSGWDGVGYLAWKYKTDTFHFKLETFDSFDYYSLNYKISSIEIQKKEPLTFIYNYGNGIKSSLYMVSQKTK